MRLDLNLVSVLEAIMLERNVTRAAKSLGLGQPAVSNALRRARSVTKDELFIKVPGGVRPTTHMLAMWPDLQSALTKIRETISPQSYDPRSDHSTFRVAITDSLVPSAIPLLATKLRNAAPMARIAFSIHSNMNSLSAIERGSLDCAVGTFPALPSDIHVQPLLKDRYVCVMRKGHNLANRLSFESFLGASHVLVTPTEQGLGHVESWLRLNGQTRDIAIIVNSFADALRIVAQSDLLACIPMIVFKTHERAVAAKARLVTQELPFDSGEMLFKLVWHERTHASPAHAWFRALIADVCARD